MDWVKLAIRYYADDKIARLPDEASELMFVRGLARAGEERQAGFIPESALPELARRRRYAACVDALVAAGLWSRVDGGYQITRWADWQDGLDALARRRAADRERQRRRRAAAGESTPDPSRDKAGMSRDHPHPSRARSRDVRAAEGEGEGEGEGVQVGDQGADYAHTRASRNPPPRCPDHLEHPNPPPCGPCADARRAHEAHDRDQAATDTRHRQQLAHDRAIATQAAIDACTVCDQHGYHQGGWCHHDPTTADRARRGAAQARAALRNTA